MSDPTNIMSCKSYSTAEEKEERIARLRKYNQAYSPLYKKFVMIVSVYKDDFGDPVLNCKVASDYILFRESELSNFSEKLPKNFNIMNNVGRAKYVVNFYDGVQTHKDGSPFYCVTIFKNKKKLKAYTDKLLSEGYIEK